MLQVSNPFKQPAPGPRQYIIDRFIPKNKLISLYGDGGVGKSLLAAFLCSCVASGSNFFGLNTTKGPVLYLDGEDDEDEFRRRAKAIENAHHVAGDLYYHRVTSPINQTFLQALQETINHYNIILIIIDSFSALSGGNLDNETIINFMNGFRPLGISVLFLDHEPKYNDTQLGPNSKKNQVRAQYHLEEWYDPKGRLLKLSQTKTNIGDMSESLYIKITSSPNSINPYSILFEQAFPTPGTHGPSTTVIMDTIRIQGPSTALDLAAYTGLKYTVISAGLTRLVRDGSIKSDGQKPATYSIL